MKTEKQLDQGADASVDDVVEALTQLGRSAGSVDEYYRECLGHVSRHFGAALGRIRLELPTRVIECSVGDATELDGAWRKPVETALLKAQVESRPLGEVLKVRSSEEVVTICAAPLHAPGASATGGIVLVMAFESKEMAQAHLAELRVLTGLMDFACPDPAQTSPQASEPDEKSGVQAALKAARFQNEREFAFALTNGLRPRLVCDSVIVGAVQGQRVRVLSISGLDEPKLRSAGTIEMVQAMEECLDAGRTILSQEKGEWDDEAFSAKYALHRQWRAASKNASVASFPLRAGERIVGVLSMQRSSERPFTKAEIEAVSQIAETMGPGLDLQHRAGRTLTSHGVEWARDTARELIAPKRFGRKLLGAAALAAIGWFLFGTMEYHSVVSSRIEPNETLQLTAPFEGRVAEAFVRAGDEVRAGDPLFRFETRELELERDQLRAEIEVSQVEIDQSIAAENWVEASLSKARQNLHRARLAAVERRIGESEVFAPDDGVILRGDVTHRIGQRLPQGELLFEFAAALDLHLELEIPERLVSDISEGLALRFASNARPDEPLDFQVERVPLSAELVDGANVFVARARSSTELPEWARAGMEGVGKIEVGRRPIWRVATKRVVDYCYRVFWL